MNTSSINTQSLNGPTSRGNNASLSSGLSSNSNLNALLIAGAILVGGLYSLPSYGGNQGIKLNGGSYSSTSVGGKHLITLANNGGLISTGTLEASLGIASGMSNGIFSDSSFGGTRNISARLQTEDTLGFQSIVGGYIFSDSVVSGGFESTSYLGGGISGGTVLMSDGLKSTSTLGGTEHTGRDLSDGISSNSVVSGKLHYPAIFTGGIFSNTEVGKEIDIQAILRGGLMSVGEANSLSLIIDAHLNDGISNSSNLESRLFILPTLTGGLESNYVLEGNLAIGAILTDGTTSEDSFDANLTTSPNLYDGIYSFSDLGGRQQLDNLLQGSIYSTHRMGGDIVEAFKDPMLNTWALEIRSATPKLEIFTPTKDI